MIGFTTYEDLSQEVKPTLEEMIAALTSAQKTDILNGYVEEKTPGQMKNVAPKATIIALYRVMEFIEQSAAEVMREDPPASVTALRSEVYPLVDTEYPGVFTQTQINAVLSKVILVSRRGANGSYTGDFTAYAGYF